MPTAGFRSGKDGRGSWNGTNFKITRWKVDPEGEELDVTNSESGGFGEVIGGVKDCMWECDFDYYVQAAPPNIFTVSEPGTLITNLVFYIGPPADLVSWTFPVAFVKSGTCESRVRGKVSGTLRGRNSATFTKPGF